MKFIKTAVLPLAAAISVVAITPAEATLDFDYQGSSVSGLVSNANPVSVISSLMNFNFGGLASNLVEPTGDVSASAAVSVSSRPASNSDRTLIPEPSNLLMLGLGVIGLFAGRYAARRRGKRKP